MARARVKVDVSGFIASVKRDYAKFAADSQIPNNIGKFMVERIRLETRRGKPFNDNGKFPELKDPPTPQIRKHLKRYNKTHPAMRPSLSAVTYTGQLMDGLGYQIRQLGVLLSFTGAREPLVINKRGETKLDFKTNAELAKDLNSRGFVIYTKKGIEASEVIMKRVRSIVLQGIRRAFKIRS